MELLGSCGLGEDVLALGYNLAYISVFVSFGKHIYVDWYGRSCWEYVDCNDLDVDMRIANYDTSEGVEGKILG